VGFHPNKYTIAFSVIPCSIVNTIIACAESTDTPGAEISATAGATNADLQPEAPSATAPAATDSASIAKPHGAREICASFWRAAAHVPVALLYALVWDPFMWFVHTFGYEPSTRKFIVSFKVTLAIIVSSVVRTDRISPQFPHRSAHLQVAIALRDVIHAGTFVYWCPMTVALVVR
jgi:hypothetical protein